LIPVSFDNQCVASVAALRETKMSSSVENTSNLMKNAKTGDLLPF
jgi:hypothetical protein